MFITLEDSKLYTLSFGALNAPTILAMGGWIGNWELWAEPFTMMSQSWRTIAYDHRGTGATIAPVESITAQRLIDDVFVVLDAYNVRRCVLAAESAGAHTALGAALKHPERIMGLVIVDGVFSMAEPPDHSPFAAGLRADYTGTLQQFVELCVPEPDSDHIKRWGMQILQRASPASAIALYGLAFGNDLQSEIPRIAQPTLILHGEQDQIASLADAQWLARTLPNAKLVILPGAGHVPTMTRPQQVASEIMNFFSNSEGK